MRDIAKSSWKIKELPGRSPLTQWPESLDDLNQRLKQLDPMSAWAEPIVSILYISIHSNSNSVEYSNSRLKVTN